MIKHLSRPSRFPQWFIAIALAITTTLPALCGGAYLALVGPAPLRFVSANTNLTVQILPPLIMDDHVPVVETQVADVTTNSVETVEVIPAENTNSVANTVVAQPAPETAEVFTSISSESVPAVVTPQMLTEYFVPIQNGSNYTGAGVSVPMAVDFAPPDARPGLSSQAVYKSE